MEERKDFDQFYNDKLLPKMQQLRAEQKSMDKWKFIALGTFLASIALTLEWLEANRHIGILVLVGFGFTLFCFIKYLHANDTFVDDYKEAIIKEIIDHLSPGIIYKPDKCVPEKEYMASSLFRSYYDNYSGEDYMTGVYNNVSFHCSEVETMSGNNTIFDGLFFTAKINSGFTTGTYVWDRNFEQLPASIMDEEYRLMPMPHVVRATSPNKSFNNYFSVCTTSSQQAGIILTAERIQRMVDLKEQLNATIAFSFVAGHAYVAIGAMQDLLDPAEYRADDKEQVQVYYYTVLMILAIIDDLKLNELL
jgi:hypothetical protein